MADRTLSGRLVRVPAPARSKLPAWTKLVESGKKAAPELLAMLSTKATFSEEQKARVLSLKKAAPAAEAPAPAPDPFVTDMEAAEAAQGSAL